MTRTHSTVLALLFLLGMLVFALRIRPAELQAQAQVTAPAQLMPPGVVNMDVTQANILQTICVPGWTKTIRPPASYTNKLKLEQMAALQLPGAPSDYEEDHLISLEVGGNPTDPNNLWPQPWHGPGNAHEKDRLENELHREVCDGQMLLVDAQLELSVNWMAAYEKRFGETP